MHAGAKKHGHEQKEAQAHPCSWLAQALMSDICKHRNSV